MNPNVLPDTERLAQAGTISKKIGFKGQFLAELFDEYPSAVRSGDWIFVCVQQCYIPFRLNEVQYRNPHAFTFVPELGCKHWEDLLPGAEWFLSGVKPVSKKSEKKLLLGYEVHDLSAGCIGTVTDVLEYPMQLLLLVNLPHTETLIPWVDAFILEVDKKKKIIRCDLPEGLFRMNDADEGR